MSKLKKMKEFTFIIGKDIQTVKQYLIDAEKFVSVHPLIYKMEDLGQNKFRVFEKVKVGFIPYHFTYTATITNNNDSIQMYASIMGVTKLSMYFTFQRVGDETIIKEKLTVRSLLPIKNFMLKLIGEQHQELFKNIGN